MNRDEQEDTTIYKVVVNHEEQYSIWPADRENPLGWNDAGKTGLKAECLEYIKEVWTDMRPLSLRKKMEEMERARQAGEDKLRLAWRLLVALVTLVICTGLAPGGMAAAPAAPSLTFAPVSLNLAPGATSTIDLRLQQASNAAGYEVDLTFNPAVVTIESVERIVGTATQPSPGRTWVGLPADPAPSFITLAPGSISFGAYSYGASQTGLSGDITLARLHLKAVATGTTALHLSRTLVANAAAQASVPPASDASITVSASGCLTGQLTLQGRASSTGATVSSGVSTTTAANGSFSLCGVTPGQRTMSADMPGYLRSDLALNVSAAGGALPALTLFGGDGDNNGRVDLIDLVLVAANYGKTIPPGDARADMNGDGTVNLFDLAMVGGNYGQEEPQPWATTRAGKTDDSRQKLALRGQPSIKLDQPAKVAAGEEFAVAVRIMGGQAVSAVDLTLDFDPTQLEPLGVAEVGAWFDPQAVFIARNEVDAKSGSLHFAATRLADATPNDGALLTLSFRARTPGAPTLHLSHADLIDTTGHQTHLP